MGGGLPPPILYMSKIHVFIDAKNLLYRAIYATKFDNRYEVKYHAVVIFLRQLVGILNKIHPTSMHIFWDAPRETVWRKKILPTYKNRDNSNYVEDISQDLKTCTEVANELFKCINLRQYYRDAMESDDLIYAATTVVHPDKSVIISSDSDLTQIPFVFDSSCVFDPKDLTPVPRPKLSPVMMKSVVGDKSDHIPGYYGIGPKKGAMLVENINHLIEYIDFKGHEVYYRNLLLTDLSLCPKLLANKVYIQRVMSSSVSFDKDQIAKLITKHKIIGLDSEYANIIPCFQKLV